MLNDNADRRTSFESAYTAALQPVAPNGPTPLETGMRDYYAQLRRKQLISWLFGSALLAVVLVWAVYAAFQIGGLASVADASQTSIKVPVLSYIPEVTLLPLAVTIIGPPTETPTPAPTSKPTPAVIDPYWSQAALQLWCDGKVHFVQTGREADRLTRNGTRCVAGYGYGEEWQKKWREAHP